MNPKVSVFGEEAKKKQKQKQIELAYLLNEKTEIVNLREGERSCHDFDRVVLLVRNYSTYHGKWYDLILCYDGESPSEHGDSCLFLGKWNGGVID